MQFNNIKEFIKHDLWEMINSNKNNERKIEDFIQFIFYILLEKKEFLMKDVLDISKEMKEKYYKILDKANETAIIGEPIKALKNIDEDFKNEMKPIIKKIKNLFKNE